MALAERLMEIKENIEEAKEKKAQAEGRLDGHFAALKKDHGVSSLKAADTKMDKLDKEIEKLQKEVSEEILEIDELMGAFTDESS